MRPADEGLGTLMVSSDSIAAVVIGGTSLSGGWIGTFERTTVLAPGGEGAFDFAGGDY